MLYIIIFFLRSIIPTVDYTIGDKIDIQDLGEIKFFEVTDFKIFQNKIYISDKAAKKVYVFNSNGVYINSSGKEGRGPGEFLIGPKQIAPNASGVYVLGSVMPHYYIYDQNLNFIKQDESIIELLDIDFIQYKNEKIYAVAFPGLKYSILVIDLKDESIAKIDLKFEIEAGLLNRYKILKLGNYWLFNWYYQNKFMVYDQDFTEQIEFKINGVREKADGVIAQTMKLPQNMNIDSRKAELINAGTFAPKGSFFEEFISLDKEYFLVQLGNQTGGKNKALIINIKGEIKQEINLPQEVQILAYSDKILYMYNSDELKIVAYEFH